MNSTKEWIYKVIASCKTPQQKENAYKLLINYKKQNYEHLQKTI